MIIGGISINEKTLDLATKKEYSLNKPARRVMMRKNQKKEWRQPKLIIIGQGRPEENVLTNCKNATSTFATGPYIAKNNCNELEGNCRACQSNAANVS
jgi:hypothetical protein